MMEKVASMWCEVLHLYTLSPPSSWLDTGKHYGGKTNTTQKNTLSNLLQRSHLMKPNGDSLFCKHK